MVSIGKSSGEDAVGLGSQSWNSADGYSKIKILRLLIQLDIDEEIALFGRKDENDNTSTNDISYRRVEYFNKFIFHLRQLIGNCSFAIDRGVDERIIIQFKERVDNVESVSDGISTEFENCVTKEKELKINEGHFRKCFRVLQQIKDDLNFPLNRASLIFRQGDSLDLDAIMRSIEDGN